MKTILKMVCGISVVGYLLTGCSSTQMADVNKKHYTVTRTYATTDSSLPAVAEAPPSPAWGGDIMPAY